MDALHRDLSRFTKYSVRRYESIEAFLESHPEQGISSITYGGGSLDLLFLNRGAPTTIVNFHAAVPSTTSTLPVFNGLGVTSRLEANVLSISDPSLELGIRLGWHLGNRTQPLQRDLPAVLRHVLASIPLARNLVFFGASGGGFASAFYASRFEGSVALAVNPQTDISRFHKSLVTSYTSAAWGTDDLLGVLATTNLETLAHNPTIAYVQNVRDEFHMTNHLQPWLRSLGENRGHVWLLLRDWGAGHVPPPAQRIKELLAAVVAADGDWHTALTLQEFDRAPSATSIERLGV